VNIDYDRIHPSKIKFNELDEDGYFLPEQDGVSIKSMYAPPDFNPAEHAALGPGFTEEVQGERTERPRWLRETDALPTETFDQLREGHNPYSFTSVDQLRTGLVKPKIIK